MRVKIAIDIEVDAARLIILERAKRDIKMRRFDAICRRRSFFKDEKRIPHAQEIIFAQLYDKIGADTIPIKKFRKWKSDYLKDIASIWAKYHNDLAFMEVSESYWQRAKSVSNDVLITSFFVEQCAKIIRAYSGKTDSKIESISTLLAIIDGGNKYELAAYLIENRCSNLSWYKWPEMIKKLSRVRMKNGVERPTLRNIIGFRGI